MEENSKEKKGTNVVMDNTSLDNIIYSNIVSVISLSEDDVEIGLCLRNPDGSAQVKHRLYFSASHFHRVAKLFNEISNELRKEK